MPENKRTFLGQYAGNPLQRIGRWAVDRLPGNQLASDGTLQNVVPGLFAGAGTIAAGLYGGPMAAGIAKKVLGKGVDTFFSPSQPGAIGPVQRESFAPPMQTQVSMLAPQLFGPGSLAPAQGQYGPYQGGYRMPSGPQSFMQQSNIPTQQTSYGLTLPDFGPYNAAPAQQSRVDANNAQYRGAQDAFRGMSGAYASTNNRQSDRGPSIFAGNNIYKV